MNIDVRGLKLMRASELESCFASAPAAEMASGVYRGGALVLSGTRIGQAVNALLQLIWQERISTLIRLVSTTESRPLAFQCYVARYHTALEWMGGRAP